MSGTISPVHDPVTWYGTNCAGTQITQWDFQNIGTLTSPARQSLVLKVPLRYLRPSIIYSVPCDRIVPTALACVTNLHTFLRKPMQNKQVETEHILLLKISL